MGAKGDIAKVTFDTASLQASLDRILKKKVKVLDDPKVQETAAREYAKTIQTYVPKKTGKLRRYRIKGRDIIYSARSKYGEKYNYALNQYETPYDQDSRTTYGTFDHWNRHLTAIEREEFYRNVAEFVARYMNEQ